MHSTFSKRRCWILHFFIASLFLIVFYQLLQLMMIRRQALCEVAEKQHKLSAELLPLRGVILDRHHKEFATNLLVPSIYAVPRMIGKKYKEAFAVKLAEILHMEVPLVLNKLNRNKSFVWLKRRIPNEAAKQIQRLRSPALGIVHESKRFYPQGDLLSQIIGFTDVDGTGLEGIELALNHELQGQKGFRDTKRDALGREVKAFEVKTTPAIDGHHVYLTIDQHIQYLTERALERASRHWHAKGATAIVMDPKTGQILAIANRPTYNPNDSGNSNAENKRNRAITDMYEPGSVFKIVTASAALNEGKVKPDMKFFCENGLYRYGGGRVLHDVHKYGTLTMEEVIIKSSNIGAVKIGALLEPHVFQKYVEGFGFGKPTGIDLPGEASGVTHPPERWSKTSPYNIPIGHEIMVTAIQVTSAMSVIANGGYLVKPYIISKIEDQAGVVLRENKPRVKRQVIRPEIAAIMRGILRRVVEEGTGKSARIEGIPAGGKTGTAQKVFPNGRGYSHNSFMASFVGFAPAEDPQYVMAVVLDDPHPSYYGGTVCAPVFKEVMEAALLYSGYIPENAKVLGEIKSQPAAPENQPKLLPARASGTTL